MAVRRAILTAAIVTEGMLVVLSLGIGAVCAVPLTLNFSWRAVSLGVCMALPLLFLNHILWRRSLARPTSVYARFSREVIVPLCQEVTVSMALVIAILSGFAEELLFRGALNTVLEQRAGVLVAALVTSALFAAVHFIGLFKRFGGMIPLYTAVGLYLWLLHYELNSLTAVMVTHGVYNFVAIVLIRYTVRRQKDA
jgi:membrane protease YdiL (CAAX protease family)